MVDVKQQALNVTYNFGTQQVEFINDSGDVILSMPMSSIMEIASDIKPVYSIQAVDAIKRTVIVKYEPINDIRNED